MKDFEQFTDKQLTELIERRSPHHPRRIDRRYMQAILEGRLVSIEPTSECRVIDCADLIEAMIQAGYHKHTMNPNGSFGMRASAYRKLWPMTVTRPLVYAGRFEQVLLVDRTIRRVDLIECGRIEIGNTDLDAYTDIDPPPSHEGNTLPRYVAFFQDGRKNLHRSVRECRDAFTKDEVGLVTVEGLHLPVQYEQVLREYGSNLAGSRQVGGGESAPYVGRFYNNKWPERIAFGACIQGTDLGSASRGAYVLPVT